MLGLHVIVSMSRDESVELRMARDPGWPIQPDGS